MKKSPHHYISLPDDFEVSVPTKSVPEKHYTEIKPEGIYITWDYQRAWLYYAGEQVAGKSYMSFELPADPKYLREFASEILELANKIENRR